MINNAPSGGTFHFTSSDGAFSFNQTTDALGVSTLGAWLAHRDAQLCARERA